MRISLWISLVGFGSLLWVAGCAGPSPETLNVDPVDAASSGIEWFEGPAAVTEGWPSWRGPSGDGRVPSQAVPVSWSSSSNVRWKAAVPGRGHASPILAAGNVVLATADEAKQTQTVIAFSADIGNVVWETTCHTGNFPDPGEIHGKATNANSTVLFDGSTLVALFFNDGRIMATGLDPKGAIQWQSEVGPFSSKFGYAPSPVRYGNFTIVAVDSWGGGYLAALETATGKTAWRISRPEKSSYSSPLIAEVGGRPMLLLSGCGTLSAFDPRTGQEIWSVEGTSEGTCGTAVTDGKNVFASGGHPERETICVSSSGDVVWRNKFRVYEPSMIVAANTLFAVNDDSVLQVMDLESGSVLQKLRLRGGFSSSPICCDDRVYVTSLQGLTYVFEYSGGEWKEAGRNQLGTDCYAVPAVASGRIYCRVGEGSGRDRTEWLYCLEDSGD